MDNKISYYSFFTKFFDIAKNLKIASKNFLEKDVIISTINDEQAQSVFKKLKYFCNNLDVFYLPSFDILPYDRSSPSNYILSERAKTLVDIYECKNKKIVITSAINILQRYNIPKDLTKSYISFKEGENYSIDDITLFFIENGYRKVSSVTEPGEFSQRGDILDIVISNDYACRINFEWNIIKSIKYLDIESQISSKKLGEISIYPSSELILNDEKSKNFKDNFLKYYDVNYTQSPIFKSIENGIKFQGAESILPIFLKSTVSIFEYLKSPLIVKYHLFDQAISDIYNEYNDFYNSRLEQNKNKDNFYPVFPPEKILITKDELLRYLQNLPALEIAFENTGDLYKIHDDFYSNSKNGIINKTPVNQLLDLLKANSFKKFLIACNSEGSVDRISRLLTDNEITFSVSKNFSDIKKKNINLVQFNISLGIEFDEIIIIPDKYLIGERRSQKSSKRKLENILKELDNFSIGEYVVHKDHGVGIYEGIENFDINGVKHDCIKLNYAKGDKLFIPVENIDLIKKYGSQEVALDYLGSVSWQKRAAKFKERIGEIAKKLINNAAKRKINSISPVEIDYEEYEKFCNFFPYHETEDQINAIRDIENDLKSSYPMDRLVCGDVGFGKTEVAMRAAFLVASDKIQKMQVAVIVPTTILARQHYENFLKRFKNTNIKISSISRLVSSKNVSEIKDKMKNGDVDIVIGTHALLAKNINFKNLGLLIIDEEQHFGVAQKEKLRELKENIHCLTLSATPIPRTLQMSLLGLKDLSIIATPPVDRLSIRTSVMPFDEIIIRDALLKEHFRGGRSFFVSPRIADIEKISEKLSKILPELKCEIAHGQMPPSDIDKIMNDFYDGKFDILLSTTIIESGIDVPASNTMIIYKPEILGLSQLYQLRGRVGRAKLRGYAYLMTDNKKMPTNHAMKRLEIMQTLDSLGAGFSIATHDMDLRGFGNILGEEQSGQIKEVGVELYNEMLEEEVLKLRNEIPQLKNSSINIKLNIPVYIPEEYIEDSNLRLTIYRRAADLETDEEVKEFICEITDRFGKIPESVNNLIEIIRLKLLCKERNIISIEAGLGGYVIGFSNNVNNEIITKFLAKYPRNTKIKPDNKIVYKIDLSKSDLIKKTIELIDQFKN